MPRRSAVYVLLAVFAGAMVLLLMLDDPTAAHSDQPGVVALFPQLSRAEHIERIEVQDVTAGTGLLLVRDAAGVWYAARMAGSDPVVPVLADQVAADAAAFRLARLTARQGFEATPENLVRYGIRPAPAYTLQFAGHDPTGRAFESVVFEVGHANPDQVAYYVWPRDADQVYLLTIDFLLGLLPGFDQAAQTPPAEPAVVTETPPVP